MNEAWVEFESAIEPLVWGKSTYTVMPVPTELEAAARAAGTRRVAGTIDGVEVNVGLNRAERDGPSFIYAAAPMQRRLGAEPGDRLRCRLHPVDPDLVPIPGDVEQALTAAARLDAFEALSPADRRRRLQPIEAAVRPPTRASRIAALVRDLG